MAEFRIFFKLIRILFFFLATNSQETYNTFIVFKIQL